MKSRILGSVIAAIISVLFLSHGIISRANARDAAALSASAELAAKGAWNPATTYAKDDIVTSRGSAWRSRRANNTNRVPGQTTPSTAAYWELFARGFNPAGVWSSAAKYQPDDLVTRSGQTWRAKLTNTNRQPAANQFWELFAAKGDPGPNTGIGAGTASVPSISFNGDGNTGIYSPGDGKIAMVGNGTLFLHNIGTQNTGLGEGALASNTAGENNTAVGSSALASNTSGHSNTAVGLLALSANTTGTENTAVGYRVLRDSTGSFNTGLGAFVLASNATGSDNTAVGRGALAGNTTGADNTAVGLSALGANTTGSLNIAVGHNAGLNPTSPSNSIFIGNQGQAADDLTIKIGTQGTQTTAFMAGISGVAVGDSAVMIDSTTGQLGVGSPSSRRYKHDIQTMTDVSATLAKLRPVTFRYNQASGNGSHPLQYGLVAEEVAEVAPDLTLFDRQGRPDGVKYHLLPSFLLAGYQAQQETIAAQAEKIATLEVRLRRLEARLPQAKAAALQ